MQQKPITQARTIDNVYNSAYWHLAQQDFTITEMRGKLARKTTNQEWVETVLADLIGKGYLKGDFDFALRFAEQAFSHEQGKLAIMRKLRTRGVTEKQASEAIAQVMDDNSIDQYLLAVSRLANSYQNFHGTTKEKVFTQLTNKGFSRSEIEHAIAQHPQQHTLRSKLAVQAERADLSKEIIKLYRKGKGKNVILHELRAKLIDVENFTDTIDKLEQEGDIDFYQSCSDVLAKKRFDLTSHTDKAKAYAYLSRKGFSSDEIKEALNPSS